MDVDQKMPFDQILATSDNLSPRRYLALDGWRGICAVVVAILHFYTTGTLGTFGIVANGHLFVDFFFVLSGFVLSFAYIDRLNSGADAGFMMWRRLGRLWPLHLATLAALITLELAAPAAEFVTGLQRSGTAFDPDGIASLASIPSNMLFLHGLGIHDRLTWNIPSWSISAEFWTYAVFALVVLISRGRTLLPAIALIVFAGGVLICYSPALMAVENGWGFFRCLASFFAGHLVYRLLLDQSVRLPLPHCLETLAVLGVALFVAYGGGTMLEFAAPLVFAGVVWLFAHEQGAVSSLLKCRPLQLLGLWSYSIYMVHTIVIAIIHRGVSVTEKLTDQTLTTQVEVAAGIRHTLAFGNSSLMDAVTLLYIFAVIGIAALTWRWIEMPAGRYWNNQLWDLARSCCNKGFNKGPRHDRPATQAGR